MVCKIVTRTYNLVLTGTTDPTMEQRVTSHLITRRLHTGTKFYFNYLG
jgi:hypothetical protein